MGIDISNEGFCDTLSVLVLGGTEIVGQDFWGCDAHARYPREPGLNHAWPVCEQGPLDPVPCSMGQEWSIRCPQELLPALWLDLHDEFGPSATRELFLDWMMVAQQPESVYCSNNPTIQSAGPATLVEVLQVAPEEDHEAICFIFGERQISHPGPTPNPCEESAGRFCYADCDGSAALDFWDLLCFQNLFIAGDAYADCDGDGEWTFFDFLCFQNEFVASCL